jgi:hypothetical protein
MTKKNRFRILWSLAGSIIIEAQSEEQAKEKFDMMRFREIVDGDSEGDSELEIVDVEEVEEE